MEQALAWWAHLPVGLAAPALLSYLPCPAAGGLLDVLWLLLLPLPCPAHAPATT